MEYYIEACMYTCVCICLWFTFYFKVKLSDREIDYIGIWHFNALLASLKEDFSGN